MAIYKAELQFQESNSEETYVDSGGKATFNYFVYSNAPKTDTEADVREYLRAFSPVIYFNLPRNKITVDQRMLDNGTDGIWSATVHYVSAKQNNQERPNPGEEGESYTVLEIKAGGGSSATVTQSKELVEEANDPVNGPAYLLGGTRVEKVVNLKAATDSTSLNVVGVPANLGSVQIVAYAWKSSTTVTEAYLNTMADAAARNVVNVGQWKGFPAGSLRLTDFQASQQAGDPSTAGWQMTFTFEYEAEVSKDDIDIGDIPAFANDKKGHHYLDILYVPAKVDNANPSVVVNAVPVRAAIHRIYDEENFQTLFNI